MPFDGIVLKNVIYELKKSLDGGRIDKIFQPEPDKIIMTIRSLGKNYKLLLSANASFPRAHLTTEVKENPVTAPNFCMVLRKYLAGGKIIDIQFYDFERIMSVNIESSNEMGDITCKQLIIEIMGKHSNIILVSPDGRIIDAIKHVDDEISSVREIMPGRKYVFPPAQSKESPIHLNIQKIIEDLRLPKDIKLNKYLLDKIKGFSPLICNEICYRSGIEQKKNMGDISFEEINRLEITLKDIINMIETNEFTPCIMFDDKLPIDFHSILIKEYLPNVKTFSSISETLDEFYISKHNYGKINSLKNELSKVVMGFNLKCNKKMESFQEKVQEYFESEKYKLFGELILANIYNIGPGSKTAKVENYYSLENEIIEIPLDENKSANANSQKYFKKYSKAKVAYQYALNQIEKLKEEEQYLDGVLNLIEFSEDVRALEEIRNELIKEGYISGKRLKKHKKDTEKISPFHYKSSDGFDIYVGKNNIQNDILTLKMASKHDIWMHTKGVHGSHVIIRKENKEVSQKTLIEAAAICAFHSKARFSSNVEVDYTAVKNVKKPSGAKPGSVIYINYNTIVTTPTKELIEKLKIF